MKIELAEMTIRDVVEGYEDRDEEGVVGYGGKLNIRPKYQREFVYADKQRDEVIHTIMQGFPLNTMYWVKTDQGDYELLDGQQRTISFCRYFTNQFSFEEKFFHNLTKDKQEAFLDYPLFVYVCEGTDSERLDWFRVINIAGEKLTDQELRNAVYTGAWLTDAKKHFSKTNCLAYKVGKDYMKGSPIRQDYLETAIRWRAAQEGEPTVERYMAKHQGDENASQLWIYYQRVIQWVEQVFPNYRNVMKGIDWGFLYNDHKDDPLDPVKLEKRIQALMIDEDVTRKSGIYGYLLGGEERLLSIRSFTANQKREAYERQDGVCPACGGHFDFDEMEGDHITPWHDGGKTTADNCQMLCKDCNRRKSGI